MNVTRFKWAALGVGAFILFWLLLSHRSSSPNAPNAIKKRTPSAFVTATNNEELRYLTAKIKQLTEQNKRIIATNQALQATQKAVATPSSREGFATVASRLNQQQAQLKQLRTQLQKLKTEPTAHVPHPTDDAINDYPVSGHPTDEKPHTTSEAITVVNDMSLPLVQNAGQTHVGYRPILRPDRSLRKNNPFKSQGRLSKRTVPYFTIPANATLADVVLQSDILAEVPVNHSLLQPAFKFKAIVGRRALLASNGLTLPPDLSGIVFEGYSVGNMALSCARGYITKLLFTWQDGSFTVVGQDAKGTELNPQDTLGYLSTPYGNPCLPGKYITDAPRVIASIAAMAGIAGGANAFAQTQTTNAINPLGSITQITGNAFQYMGGKALGTGADKALDWYTKRINGIFDVVYIPASVGRRINHVVVNITQTIPIDKTIKGRKLRYAIQTQNRLAHSQLD